MSESDLNELTKSQIADYAQSLGIEGVSTTQTKAEMIAIIVANQEG